MKTIDIEYLTAEDLELEVLCSYCHGSGWILKGKYLEGVPPEKQECRNCQGRRWVITDLGEKILDLVRRYETRARTGEKKDPPTPQLESEKSGKSD